jgi:hypothetical protein
VAGTRAGRGTWRQITGGALLPILTQGSNLGRSWQRSATVAKSINLATGLYFKTRVVLKLLEVVFLANWDPPLVSSLRSPETFSRILP